MEHVGDLAGLSLVIPESYIIDWQHRQPWKEGYAREIFIPTDEIMQYHRK
jgi:hypothetical protein